MYDIPIPTYTPLMPFSAIDLTWFGMSAVKELTGRIAFMKLCISCRLQKQIGLPPTVGKFMSTSFSLMKLFTAWVCCSDRVISHTRLL